MTNGSGTIRLEPIVAWTSRALVLILAWLAIQSLGRLSKAEDSVTALSTRVVRLETQRESDIKQLERAEKRIEDLRDAIAAGRIAFVPRDDRQ